MKKNIIFKLILFTFFLFTVLFFILFSAVNLQAEPEEEYSFNYPTHKFIFNNGLTFINRTVKEAELSCIEVLVKVGSAKEGKYSGSGVTHFLEHVLFKSNNVYKPGEVHKLVRSWGGFINGYTGKDYTRYKIIVLKEYLPKALELIKNMLFEVDFDKDLINKERSVILNEMKMKQDEPQYIATRLLFETIYNNHPYSFPVIGYKNEFEKINSKKLEDFYNKNYILSNMIISIVGSGQFNKNLNLVKDLFISKNTDMAVGGISEPKNQNIDRKLNSHIIVEEYPTDLVYFNLSFPGIDIKDKDLYALDILASILGDGGSSVLNREINIKKGLVNYISAYNYTPLEDGVFNINASTDMKRLKPAIKEIFKNLRKIKDGKIEQKEIKKVINQVISTRILNLETVESQASSLVANEFLTGNYNFDEQYVDKLRNIDKKDIIKAGSKYLNFDKFYLTILLPEGQRNKFVNSLSSEGIDLNEDYRSGKIEIPVNSSGELFSEISSEDKTKKIVSDFKKFILPNGINVLIKQDSTLPIVTMRCIFKGGVRMEEKKNNGISKLTSSMLSGGTDNLSKTEILETIEQTGGSISTDSGYNSFGIGMNVLKEHVNTGFDLLFNILKNSNFPKHTFLIEKQKQKQAVKSQKDDIFSVGLKNLRLTMYDKHPYRFMPVGTIDSLNNIKREDIINFYDRYVNPENMVLVIIGDISLDVAYEKVKKELGFWKKNKKYYKDATKQQIDISGVKNKKIYLNKKQKLLMYGFKGIKITDDDRYPLRVLTRIISGGGSRLWQVIREKQGLSYSLGAYFIPGIEPGYFSIYIQTRSENLDKIKKLIKSQINIIKQGDFEEKEIEVAKSELIGGHLRNLQVNASLAYQVGLDEIYGLGFQNFKLYDNKIKSVTKEDIKEVANKYIDLNNCVIVEVLPQAKKD